MSRSAPGSDARARWVVLNWRDSSHPQAGGAELYCERVAAELGASGEDVTLVTSRPPGQPAHEVRAGYDVVRAGSTYTVYLHALVWLLRHRRAVHAVVDSQNGIPFFSPLAVSRRTPVLMLIHHVHQQQFATHFGPVMSRVGRWLEGPASRRVYGARSLVTVSPSTRSDVRRQLRLTGAISVLPCGMDAPLRGGERSAVPRVVVVGRLVAHKRVELLLDAVAAVARAVPDVELHVLGDGPARQELQEHAAAAGIAHRTTFHGRVSDDRRDELVASAWLTVIPSAGEGWGVSVIEANAAGVPALAYDVSGLRDAILDGRTGWLVEPGEPLAPAVRAALEVVAQGHAAQQYAEACRAWAGHFSWPTTAAGVRRAMDLERERLRSGRQERRHGNDLASVVEIPTDLLPPGWEAQQRRSDSWVVSGRSARGLLRGADEIDVAHALNRLRVDALDPSVRVVLARPVDLLGGPVHRTVPAEQRVAEVMDGAER